MEGSMRIVLMALMIVLLAAPAQAQMRMGKAKQTLGGTPEQVASEKKKAAERDKAYKSALDKIPDQKPADPWGKLR
jgi:hypothetical protein